MDTDTALLNPTSAKRAELEQLLQERRYEEAVELLHRARWQAPDAPELSRGIQHVKQRLLRRYQNRIGSLDQVPRQTGVQFPWSEDAADAQALLALADGISTFGDIVHESRL